MVKTLFPGDVVTEIDCPGCGQKVKLKVSKSGTLGYFCQTVIPEAKDKKGRPLRCWTRMMFGAHSSERVKAEFLEQFSKAEVVTTEKDLINVQPKEEISTTPATGATDSDPPKPRAGNSFFSYITG